MRAGRLRTLLTFQVDAGTANDLGEVEPDWTDDFSCRGEVVPESGSEVFEADRVVAQTIYRVRIRYRAGITAKHRVLVGDRVFHLLEPPQNVDERSRELVLRVVEREGVGE